MHVTKSLALISKIAEHNVIFIGLAPENKKIGWFLCYVGRPNGQTLNESKKSGDNDIAAGLKQNPRLSIYTEKITFEG